MKPPSELSDNHKKMLAWIQRSGAVSTSRLLAQTDLSPREAWDMLNQLAEWELIIIRDDPSSADGKLVVAAPTAAKM